MRHWAGAVSGAAPDVPRNRIVINHGHANQRNIVKAHGASLSADALTRSLLALRR